MHVTMATGSIMCMVTIEYKRAVWVVYSISVQSTVGLAHSVLLPPLNMVTVAEFRDNYKTLQSKALKCVGMKIDSCQD